MTLQEKELLNWAKSFQPTVNTLQLTKGVLITDLKKYLNVISLRMESNEEGLSFRLYRSKLLEVKKRIEEEGI